MIPLPERFESKIEFTSSCWLWISTKYRTGYGRYSCGGKAVAAHRFSWSHFFGDPKDLFVLHKCDVKNCVNPDHLFVGTQQDNVDDMMSKGRGAFGDTRGERNGRVKLSEWDIQEIRDSYGQGLRDLSQYDLAKKYGVCQGQISRIVNQKNWSKA